MYINYGDVDFFEHGRLADTEHSDTEIPVLYCEPFPDEEDQYLFADCTVCLDDDWIDWDAVKSFYGELPDIGTDEGKALRAIAAVEYYGVENFSSPYNGYIFTRAEIRDTVKYYLIAYDRLRIE